MRRWHGPSALVEGLRASVHENSTAYGFSIMITATFGVVSALEPRPVAWHNFLFAVGAVTGFTLVMSGATKAFRETGAEAEKGPIEAVAALLNFSSVLGGVGAAALVAWLGRGWYVWLTASIAASATYVLINGIEYAVAAEEEEDAS